MYKGQRDKKVVEESVGTGILYDVSKFSDSVAYREYIYEMAKMAVDDPNLNEKLKESVNNKYDYGCYFNVTNTLNIGTKLAVITFNWISKDKIVDMIEILNRALDYDDYKDLAIEIVDTDVMTIKDLIEYIVSLPYSNYMHEGLWNIPKIFNPNPDILQEFIDNDNIEINYRHILQTYSDKVILNQV